MKTMTGRYLGQLSTEDTHLKSNNKLITDAPTDNNGKGQAFSPTDLTCASLSSCMMTIMGIIAEREGIDMTGLSSEITKVMAAEPRRISEIHIAFHWASPPATAGQLVKLKRAALTCPVALSLHPEIKQQITFDF